MVETFTPAGCGSPRRRRLALVLFTLGAVVGAATIGALFGALGAALPSRVAIGVALAVAVVGFAREAGVRAIPLPERRWQVPEPWRREQPLAAWSTGYGLLLGLGVATHQPAATFWVVCAGALALADAAAGALCLMLFGVGRAVMLVVPGGDPLRCLAGVHRMIRPVNALVIAGCAVLLVPAAATAAVAPRLPSGQSDPSVSGQAIAYTDQANGVSNVVVRETGTATPAVFPAGSFPAIDGDTLAYVDATGIRVVLWRTGQEVARIDGPFTTPAVSGPRIAYVERAQTRQRLLVRNISTGASRVIARVGLGRSIGRPSFSGFTLAWHVSAGDQNDIFTHLWTTKRTTRVVSSRRAILNVNPVVARGNLVWVQGNGERSSILQRHLLGGPVRQIAAALGPRFLYWTTAIDDSRIYATRITVDPNIAIVHQFRWSPLPAPRTGR